MPITIMDSRFLRQGRMAQLGRGSTPTFLGGGVQRAALVSKGASPIKKRHLKRRWDSRRRAVRVLRDGGMGGNGAATASRHCSPCSKRIKKVIGLGGVRKKSKRGGRKAPRQHPRRTKKDRRSETRWRVQRESCIEEKFRWGLGFFCTGGHTTISILVRRASALRGGREK